MRQVFVDIERLVLTGFRFEDRCVIAGAIEEELNRLLGTHQAAERLSRLDSVPFLKAGEVRLGAGAKAYEVGVRTAQGVGTLIQHTPDRKVP